MPPLTVKGITMANMHKAGAGVWAGRVLTFLVVALMVADGVAQILTPPFIAQSMQHTGYDPAFGPRLAVVTLSCAVLLAIPQTAVLGAILLTGFLGGAIATHVRIGEIGSPPQLICLALGIATWGGLYLRDARLRALLPFRSGPATPTA
jgi:hypothetical protein